MNDENPKTTTRLAPGIAKERIIEAAERLFSLHGLEAVSFRDLAGEAAVSLSAIHYHYGSKQAVLEEIFARRASVMTQRRVELLQALNISPDTPPGVPAILDAFLRPAFEVVRGDRYDLFNRLRARLALDQNPESRQIISEAYDENDHLFLDALTRALPHLKRSDLYWRFHFLVGSVIYTMSDSGQLSALSNGTCDASNMEMALSQLVSNYSALFLSPAHL